MGRKTCYTPELGEKIAELIREGSSLRAVCRREDMPALSTVSLWIADPDHPFSEQHSRARTVQAYMMVDRMLDAADGVLRGELEPDAVRVACSQYHKIAKSYNPDKFGDRTRIDQNVKGGIVAKLEVVPPAKNADEWLASEDEALREIGVTDES